MGNSKTECGEGERGKVLHKKGGCVMGDGDYKEGSEEGRLVEGGGRGGGGTQRS